MSGLVMNRIVWKMVTPEEDAHIRAIWEERAFQRRASQGQVACPSVISDAQGGVGGLQSMADGKFYDSKSNMRKHYREANVTEVGNDSSLWSGKRQAAPSFDEIRVKKEGIERDVHRAASAVDTMSDESIRARKYERETRSTKATSLLKPR